MKNTLSNKNGFTIVELLIVIVVIGIFATITIVGYSNVQARANDTVVKSDLKNMSTTLELWKVDNSGYPDPSVAATNNLQAVG